MKFEKCCGTIIFDGDKVLLIKHNVGHWSFPKGHVEENETEFETALRETKEETGLDVEIISEKRYVTTYSPKEGVMKDVIYFIAKKINSEIKVQEEEISIVDWINIEEAKEKITYKSDKELFEKVIKDYIKK